MRARRWMAVTAAGLAMAALVGCASVSYYGQAARGHIEVMWKSRPIADLLEDPALDPALRATLGEVLAVRDFAAASLALPDNDSYRSYADLGRPHVVWAVFAAPEFATRPKEWCFLIVGCLSYRGYFEREEAEALAARLREEGQDTFVTGIAAYSTLGWFDDPLLNTMLKRSPDALAGLVFHELAHQRLYIDDDTAFNESFATAVEIEGVRRWKARRGEDAAAFERAKARERAFADLVARTRERLAARYAAGGEAERLRADKRVLLDDFADEYRALRADWGEQPRLDRWVEEGVNNAKLASVGVYHHHVPAFAALLAAQGGDLERFYAEAERIGALPAEERRRVLRELSGY